MRVDFYYYAGSALFFVDCFLLYNLSEDFFHSIPPGRCREHVTLLSLWWRMPFIRFNFHLKFQDGVKSFMQSVSSIFQLFHSRVSDALPRLTRSFIIQFDFRIIVSEAAASCLKRNSNFQFGIIKYSRTVYSDDRVIMAFAVS